MSSFRNMSPEPSVFWCPSCTAKLNAGKKTDVVTCTNCGTDLDLKALRSRVTETWNALEQEADQLQVRFVPFSTFGRPHVFRPGSLQKTLRKGLSLSPADTVNCLILSATLADFSTRWVFFTKIYFMLFSASRRSSTFGRLKGEPGETRATCIRLKKSFVLTNFSFKISILMDFNNNNRKFHRSRCSLDCKVWNEVKWIISREKRVSDSRYVISKQGDKLIN